MKFRFFKSTKRTGGNGFSGDFSAILGSGRATLLENMKQSSNSSTSISKKLVSKARPREFVYVSHLQWAVFLIYLLFDHLNFHNLSTMVKIFGICLWFIYLFLVIRLRYRFNQQKLEDHCHLMAFFYSCCCPCSYAQMGAELLERKSAIITV